MPLKIKMPDGSFTEVTLRPIVDVDQDYCSATDKMRKKALRKKIRISHDLTRQMRIYKDLQIHLMQTSEKCTKKDAMILSEDPDPYDKTYVFYCLKQGAAV